ncbi:MAG: dockerin type I repeat-containing protein [Muribaculaceae bacterium]|nr:dockerin type I repeat-containing protein [Muribaculaceae bacterium]
MKRSALLLLFLVSILVAHAADVLLEFKTYNFDGWVYTQSGVEINNNNISQDNINLYGDYALISPEITAPNVKSITVNVVGRTNGYEESEYNNTLGKVYVQLINDKDSVLQEVKHTFTTKVRDRNFEVDFEITDIADEPFKLRLACWDANIESRFSVRKVFMTVKEYNLSGVVGDVNNDGVVTSADVTSLYDFLLTGDASSALNGDVNGDGSITSTDVTEVYNILLGVSLK